MGVFGRPFLLGAVRYILRRSKRGLGMCKGIGIVRALALVLAFVCGGTGVSMAQVWERFDARGAARWVYVSDA